MNEILQIAQDIEKICLESEHSESEKVNQLFFKLQSKISKLKKEELLKLLNNIIKEYRYRNIAIAKNLLYQLMETKYLFSIIDYLGNTSKKATTEIEKRYAINLLTSFVFSKKDYLKKNRDILEKISEYTSIPPL